MTYSFYEKLFTYLCFIFILSCCLECLNYIWSSIAIEWFTVTICEISYVRLSNAFFLVTKEETTCTIMHEHKY